MQLNMNINNKYGLGVWILAIFHMFEKLFIKVGWDNPMGTYVAQKSMQLNISINIIMRGSRGGRVVQTPPPRNMQSLISSIILEMKKIIIFSYLCTSTVIRQTEINQQNNNQITRIQEFLNEFIQDRIV